MRSYVLSHSRKERKEKEEKGIGPELEAPALLGDSFSSCLLSILWMNRQGMIMYKFLDGSRFLFMYCKTCFSYLHRKTFISGVRKLSRRDLRDHWVQFPEWPTREGCQATGPEFPARLELMCCFQVCHLWTCTRMFQRPHPTGLAEKNGGGHLMPFPLQSLHCLNSSWNEFSDHFFSFHLSYVWPTSVPETASFIIGEQAGETLCSRKQPFPRL